MPTIRHRLLALTALLAIPASLLAADAPSLDDITNRLASEKFSDRQAAQADLEKLPTARMPDVLAAAAAHPDDETKARLELAAWTIAARQLETQAAVAPPVRAHLRGRVIDESGKPLAKARVTARTAAMGNELWSAREFHATTDDTGRYDLPVPFLDTNYYISAEVSSHASPYLYTLARQVPISDLVCRSYPASPAVIKGTLLDAGGIPLPNHPFQILGEYADLLTTTTDAQGQFKFENVPYLGQAIAVAKHKDTVAPITIIRETTARTNPLRITLAPASTLKGTVLSNDNRPLAKATVRIRPNFCSGLVLTATTDKNGAYSVTNLAPGQYVVTADSPTHLLVPPGGYEFELPPATLHPGQTSTHDLRLQPMGIVAGHVLSADKKPLANALVAILSNFRDASQEKWAFAWTDNDGLFCIGTGRPEQLTLLAFTPEHGLARATLKPLRPGAITLTDLTLPGSLRIKGTVTDPTGKPVPNVWCIGSTLEVKAFTGPDGSFDLGRVSFGPPAKDNLPGVYLRAPRPAPGDGYTIISTYDSHYVKISSRDKAPQFFKHATLAPVDPATADNLRITLEPAELLEIAGVVKGPAGKPLPNASLDLFRGNADPKTWTDFSHPGPATGGGKLIMHNSLPIARSRTDSAGRFQLWTIRNDSQPLSLPETDTSKYSIGIWTPAASTLTQNIEVPKNKSTLELTLDLKD